MRQQQSGFTLVELVVVIVILGILAATALPRFINLTNDARRASVNGLAGGLRSTVGVVQARYFATGNNTATSVTLIGGSSVTVAAGTGIPTAATINNGLQSIDGFTSDSTTTAGVNKFIITGDNAKASANCNVTYTESTGAVVATTSGC